MSSSYLTCPDHVRSADLGALTVMVDLRTGRVETLLGWAREVWMALAATGDIAAARALSTCSPAQADELLARLCADGKLVPSLRPRPFAVATAPVTTSSWGTQEIPAGIVMPTRTGIVATAAAALALGIVLLTGRAGRRDGVFSRITALLTAVTRAPARRADARAVEGALDSVRNVAALVPVRVACLEETAAAVLVLALTGRRAQWCHGVAADPLRLHAWIALDGQPVAEPASTTRYTPLLRIPNGAAQSGERP